MILILAAIWFREQMLLTDILKRLGALETLVNQVKDQLAAVKQRLIALETRVLNRFGGSAEIRVLRGP